jgi:chromosome transmission fidelity protein 4
MEMPKGEEIQCLALGEGWAAIATDKRNVRIFSIGGIQKHLFSTAGPIVTIAANGSQLAIVYHLCHGLPGDQCLWVKWINVEGRRPGLGDGCLPLSPKSTLSWIGCVFLFLFRQNCGYMYCYLLNVTRYSLYCCFCSSFS